VNPDAGGLGFRLQPGSPAIDRGQVINGVTTAIRVKRLMREPMKSKVRNGRQEYCQNQALYCSESKPVLSKARY